MSSAQDGASADKLAELIPEPFERVDAASLDALPPTAAGGCRTRARLELRLDSVGQSVRLLRCRDATVLQRGLDPEAARQTPYLGAFVAAELLAINRELDVVEARTVTGEADGPPAPTTSTASGLPTGTTRQSPERAALAAVSGTEPPPPDEVETAPLALYARAGAELTLWGAPFDHSVRPNFGLGLLLTPDAAALAWFAEVNLGMFALAEQKRGRDTLELQRHDGDVHAGVRMRVGPMQLAAFALLRASLTFVEYTSDLVIERRYVRYGLGAGLEAAVPLGRRFAVYLQGKLDVATSRSDYQVAKTTRLQDPVSLLWIGLGLTARLYP